MVVLKHFNALTLSQFENFLQTNHSISMDLTETNTVICNFTDTAA